METSFILLLLFAFPKPESSVGFKWLLFLWVGCLWWAGQGGTDPDQTTPAIAACESEQRSLLKLLAWGTGLEVKCGNVEVSCFIAVPPFWGKREVVQILLVPLGLKGVAGNWLGICLIHFLSWDDYFVINDFKVILCSSAPCRLVLNQTLGSGSWKCQSLLVIYLLV